MSALRRALRATFCWSGNGGQADSNACSAGCHQPWRDRDAWLGAKEEEEMAEARAGSSAEQKIRPHFLTSDPCQSELPLGLFDAKPDIFIYISFSHEILWKMDTTSSQIGGDYKIVCGQCLEDKRQWHFYAFCFLGSKNPNQPLPYQLTIKQFMTALQNTDPKQGCLVSWPETKRQTYIVCTSGTLYLSA